MSTLFERLIDDAAMFPPGNADATTAMAEHLRYRAGAMDRFVGPLLVHVDRWVEIVAAHAAAASPPMDVVVLGTTTPPETVPGLRVVGFELPVLDLPLPTAPDDEVTVACEVNADDHGLLVLRHVASADRPRFLVKFRTGGTAAAAFPDEATVARVLVAGVRAGVAMKFTAGLHHAVRFRDGATGFEHHGFLNLLVAAHLALGGADAPDVAEVLARRDGHPLADEVRVWTAEDVAAVRSTVVSFGCCGVEDPVEDLVELGLLVPEGEVR